MDSDSDPRFMLTTLDNPYSPYDQWDEWLAFDERHRYNSLGLIARLAHYSDEMNDGLLTAEYERVVEEIVVMNVQGNYALYYKSQ
jgi:hypothetical protein